MTTSPRVVIVGGGLAGLRTAEALRDQGHTGQISLISDEQEPPYDRPPLSKQVLSGAWPPSRIQLRSHEELVEKLGITLMLGRKAAALDTRAQVLHLTDGTTQPYDGLVIATGTRARRLGPAQQSNLHVVRTLADSTRLRERLEAKPAPSVAIVGAGFIGAEVAAAARAFGAKVTIVEAAASPLERQLGVEQGRAVSLVHERHGVELRCGVGVQSIEPDGLLLADGTSVEANEIVIGVGVIPNVDWLAGSGVQASESGSLDGVVTDASLRAGPSIVAAGDVVRWPHPRYGAVEPHGVRIEHWTNAAESAMHAASTLLCDLAGAPANVPFAPVPYFWSDLYPLPSGCKVQLLGRTTGFDEVRVVAGSIETGRWLALYRRGDEFVAALGVTMMRQLAPLRLLLEQGVSWSDAVAATQRLD